MGTNAEVLERIRKLLSLSRSANEHEAALAASRAAELMLKHQISEAQLSVTTGQEKIEPIGEETMGAAMRRIVHWRGSLAGALVEHFGCDYFWQWQNTPIKEKRVRCECGWTFKTRTDWRFHADRAADRADPGHAYADPDNVLVTRKITTMRIVGRPSSVQACSYLYAYLANEIERLAEERYDPDQDQNRIYTTASAAARTWRESFRYGAIRVISERLLEMRRGVMAEARAAAKVAGTEAATCTALAKIDDRTAIDGWMKQKHPKMTPIRGSSARVGGDGYAAGQAAGRELNLGTGRQGLGAPARQLKG